MPDVTAAVTFGTAYLAFYAGHQVADYWAQTDCQAQEKGLPGWIGRLACTRHVTTMTAAKVVALVAVTAVTGLPLPWWPWVAAAIAIDAISHYWADRRTTLVWLADKLDRWGLVPGKAFFVRLGDPKSAPLGTGAYGLDQSWHRLWMIAAALVVAAGV